jgi:hypothetical protein
MLFLLVWLFQTEEKPAEEEAIEISTISMPLKRQHSPTTSKRMIGQASTSYSSRHAIAPSSVIPNSEFRIPNSSNHPSLPVLTASHLNPKVNSSFPLYSGKLQQGITTTNISPEGHGQGRSWYSQGSGVEQENSWRDGLLKEMTEPPLAQVDGSGKSISGYFNISQVKYEDTSDVIRTTALRNLARTMNRWTMIETKVLPDPISLDDKEIFRVPLIYIASHSAFAFSHKERQNLRDYLYNGGFLLFSDISDLPAPLVRMFNPRTSRQAGEQMLNGPVANSIQFELWKILGNDYNLQPITNKHPLNVSFFDFSRNLPVETNNGQTGLFGISLTNRLTVLYDASGYGLTWVKNDDKDDKALKFGVNIIVYVLTTSLAK